MPKLLAAVWLSILGTVSSGCVDIVATGTSRYVERVERSFAVTGRPDVSVSTFDGSIEVHSWDRPDVLVVIEKMASDKGAAERIEVRAEQTGNRIVLDVIPPADQHAPLHWSRSRGARLIVSMPEAGDLLAEQVERGCVVHARRAQQLCIALVPSKDRVRQIEEHHGRLSEVRVGCHLTDPFSYAKRCPISSTPLGFWIDLDQLRCGLISVKTTAFRQ